MSLEPFGTVTRYRHIPYLSLTADEATIDDVFANAGRFGATAQVYRERVYSVCPRPAEGNDGTHWNLDLVRAPAAWRVTRGDGVTVAVIDTGADYRHREITSRFSEEKGVDFTGGRDPFDDNGHGTHVAGTVAGANVGVAPGAHLLAVKVLDADGFGSETAVLRGIEWCIDRGVAVMNMSLGSSFASAAERDLIAVAASKGIAIACAAGNDGTDTYDYPASYDGATSVAAVNRTKRHAPFSNRNDRVDCCAPGVAVYSCVPGGTYDTLSGTSMASPHVAGAYALLAATPAGAREDVLRSSAEALGDPLAFGAGLIDCARAVRASVARRASGFPDTHQPFVAASAPLRAAATDRRTP
jgi:subtilisin family serine protease